MEISLGLKPGMSGRKAQMNPLSYCGTLDKTEVGYKRNTRRRKIIWQGRGGVQSKPESDPFNPRLGDKSS